MIKLSKQKKKKHVRHRKTSSMISLTDGSEKTDVIDVESKTVITRGKKCGRGRGRGRLTMRTKVQLHGKDTSSNTVG